jgi:hypothetical protein
LVSPQVSGTLLVPADLGPLPEGRRQLNHLDRMLSSLALLITGGHAAAATTLQRAAKVLGSLDQLGKARQSIGDLAGAEVAVAEEGSVAAAIGSPLRP